MESNGKIFGYPKIDSLDTLLFVISKFVISRVDCNINLLTAYKIIGLLVSGMFATAKQMLDNFVAFIDLFGFIPNGSRVYYLNRSHPPYFGHMVDMFYEFASDSSELSLAEKQTLKRYVLDVALPAVINEYEYWMANKSIDFIPDDNKKEKQPSPTIRMNIYKASTDKPRPESYFEDISTVRFRIHYTRYHIILFEITKFI
jgi:alpha,alpha-trehalase